MKKAKFYDKKRDLYIEVRKFMQETIMSHIESDRYIVAETIYSEWANLKNKVKKLFKSLVQVTINKL
jgi:hypothetical protein